MEAMWLWRQVLGIKWSDKVGNKDVPQLAEEDTAIINSTRNTGQSPT